MNAPADQLLFSYGVFLDPEVQRTTFGRVVESEPATLSGYTADYVEITDARFADLSGLTMHPRLRATGNPRDKVTGRVLQVTDAELDAIDQLQVTMFRRAQVTLADGSDAWIYVPA
ncbi:gamma-glutamylcyclotransferase family protein [Microbacterium terricola]|uniref:Gamma-glutamylcyclotransferase AIG2-like domain-containing protein n=1 Tax=Microbacterium terricola TaxID=344163 RepID=A0ABM8E038_9MICO|nr:gamma-glutamylcyclotransferase family protein [Microbacterium terricola]UYK41048.1 gamma-glutamylcyclotransferase [Microbacterium terricola]BDV31195.1 hypothetical protein Microterr_18550 [Microbacterium terricola]